MGGVSWYKLVVHILLSAKRRTYFCKSIAVEIAGVPRHFLKSMGVRVDLILLKNVCRGIRDLQRKSFNFNCVFHQHSWGESKGCLLKGCLISTKLPKVGIPKSEIPKVGSPKPGIPRAGIPKVGKTQSGTLPETEIPKPGIPKSGIPKAGIPKLGIPKLGTDWISGPP